MSHQREIIIIGAGAAGLTAAIFAAEAGAAVTLLEQNDKPGCKLAATGNGRGNLTNMNLSADAYHGGSEGFSDTVLDSFGLNETLDFFWHIGLSVTIRDGWVYPRSNQAKSIVDLLEAKIRSLKVKLKTREKVTALFQENSRWIVKTETWSYAADAVILAGGSKASRIPGSDGSCYPLAKKTGHRIIKLLPALTGLKCRGDSFKAWAGVRTEGRATLYIDRKMTAAETGELQLTDYGVSGIPIFQLSRFAAEAVDKGFRVSLKISFLPEYNKDTLYILLKDRETNCPWLSQSGRLTGLLPEKLVRVLLKQPDIYEAILAFPLEISGTAGFEQAQVCAGGVDTLEVNANTLESRRHPGLYFAGELLDIDGPCGGYNLQWAWSSGALAGKCAALKNVAGDDGVGERSFS